MITELRRYRIKPDRLDSWLAFFAEFLDTTLVRADGSLEPVALDRAGERGGSRGDVPPTGWVASEGRRFTRKA